MSFSCIAGFLKKTICYTYPSFISHSSPSKTCRAEAISQGTTTPSRADFEEPVYPARYLPAEVSYSLRTVLGIPTNHASIR